MSTENEKSSNNQYLIWNEEKDFKKIVTYRCNVIKEIQQHTASNKSLEIDNFSSESVTDERFEKFIRIAENAGYTIYKIIKL